ncbi:MAG: SIS domain-containing protein [Ktedonobacterales bacterium]
MNRRGLDFTRSAQSTTEESLRDVTAYLLRLSAVMSDLPREPLAHITQLMLDAGRKGHTVFVFGNGGSAATASHLACDLAKTASVPGHPRLRALALTDNVPLLTAWGNDASYDVVFAEQVRSLVRRRDLVIAISASGNSPNVLAGAEAAREAGALVIGVTGFGGGKLKALCDVCLVVPSNEYGPVEDLHMILVHAVTAALRAALTREASAGAREGAQTAAGVH